MKFKEQAERYIQQIQARRRNPVRPGTVRIYQSYLDSRILPEVGNMTLVSIENGIAKAFIGKLNAAGLAPATINSIFKVFEAVISSAVDFNGNEMYPRKWNHEFIDLPIVQKSAQNARTVTPEQVNTAVSSASRQNQALFTMLAASGARIGEILALKAYSGSNQDSFWSPDDSLIRIQSTMSLQTGQLGPVKTTASDRVVDLSPEVNRYLKQAGLPSKGYLFTADNGSLLRYNTSLGRLEDVGITEGFHAFRRFRITYLESQNVPRGLAMYWTGHAARDVHETYIRIGQDLKTRQEWAIKAGIGFELPTN